MRACCRVAGLVARPPRRLRAVHACCCSVSKCLGLPAVTAGLVHAGLLVCGAARLVLSTSPLTCDVPSGLGPPLLGLRKPTSCGQTEPPTSASWLGANLSRTRGLLRVPTLPMTVWQAEGWHTRSFVAAGRLGGGTEEGWMAPSTGARGEGGG